MIGYIQSSKKLNGFFQGNYGKRNIKISEEK